MHLENVTNGHSDSERAVLDGIQAATGQVSDVLRILIYRGDFFGLHMAGWAQAVLRGDSDWSVGERELMGSFTAGEHQCPI